MLPCQCGLPLLPTDQTGHAPVRQFRHAALAVRRTRFPDLKVDALAVHFDQRVSEKPTVFVDPDNRRCPPELGIETYVTPSSSRRSIW